jgi:hypothetical protein
MSITPERWLSNLIDAARSIADNERQERRWLAPDAYAWERPEEEINVLMDDSVFEGFLEKFGATFSLAQATTATALCDAVNAFCNPAPDDFLNPAEVLADPRWHDIRQKARSFISAFEGQWPPTNSAQL